MLGVYDRRAAYRKSRGYDGAVFGRANFERAAKLSNALAHPAQSDSVVGAKDLREAMLDGNSFALVTYFESEAFLASEPDFDICRFALRMAIHIAQALLHDSKYGNFDVRGKTTDLRRKIHGNFYFAAFREPIGEKFYGG